MRGNGIVVDRMYFLIDKSDPRNATLGRQLRELPRSLAPRPAMERKEEFVRRIMSVISDLNQETGCAAACKLQKRCRQSQQLRNNCWKLAVVHTQVTFERSLQSK